MLLRFQVSNHRSIATAVQLSMVAVDRDRPAARRIPEFQESILTTAGIYGANASGKSNVLESLRWLSHAVRFSLRTWEDEVPRDPFRFGEWPSLPTSFDVEMMIDAVRYEYRLEVDNSSVVSETLYSYPKKQRRTIFKRDGMEIHARRGLGGLTGAKNLITPTTLTLSAAMRVEDIPEISRFATALTGIETLAVGRRARGRRLNPFSWGGPYNPLRSTDRLFLRPENAGAGQKLLVKALELLKFADLGIQNVKVVEPEEGDTRTSPYLQLVHAASGEEVAFDLHDESDGTLTWFYMIGPVLRALLQGQVVLCDEIDASLHPKLSARLLDLFQDPSTNPDGAQLIFTTHDTSLLGSLNRDEVWFTEKHDGATELFGLAEFGGDQVRRSMNLERAYLRGRFGAVPELDPSHLLRSLNQGSQDKLLSDKDLVYLGVAPTLFDEEGTHSDPDSRYEEE